MFLFSGAPACGGPRADAIISLRMLPPRAAHIAFWPVRFIRAPLPLSPLPDAVRVTTNGRLVSTLAAGHARDASGTVRCVGLPYGMLARFVLLYLATAVVRESRRTVSLGPSLSVFLRELGVGNTGGDNGRIGYLYDQLSRLASCTFSDRWTVHEYDAFHAHHAHAGRGVVEAGTNGAVAEAFALWHRNRSPVPQQPRTGAEEQAGGCFELSPRFFETTRKASVPLDLRAVHVLRQHPMAFDAYAWATYTAAALEREGRSQSVVAWKQLHEQFGCSYARVRDFARAFQRALKRVRLVWPELRYHVLRGRLAFTTTRPHVPREVLPAGRPPPEA